MADRRMFTKKVTDDDNFLSLSSSAQALYLHLSMAADDDGFCNQVAVSMFKAHASTQDLQALLDNKYLLQFENGVVVIKHWRMANAIRKDRYNPTSFQEQLKQLDIKANGSYSIKDDWLPDGCQVVAERLPQVRLGKDRIDKVNISTETKRFTKPTIEDIKSYCEERHNSINAQKFYDYYEARGWELRKGQKMKDWKACVRTWENNQYGSTKNTKDYGIDF